MRGDKNFVALMISNIETQNPLNSKKNQMQLQKGFKHIVLEFTITTGYYLAQTSSVVEQSSRNINDLSKTR